MLSAVPELFVLRQFRAYWLSIYFHSPIVSLFFYSVLYVWIWIVVLLQQLYKLCRAKQTKWREYEAIDNDDDKNMDIIGVLQNRTFDQK